MCAERIPNERGRPGPEKDAGGFGEALRRAREARGLTLAAIAEKTRIAAHHLAALERSDLDALPAGPFGRAYIRSYAEALGIDAGPVLDAHHAQEARRGLGTRERDERLLQELSHLVGRGEEAAGPLARLRWQPWRVAAAVGLVVVLGTSGWLLARRATRGASPQARTTAAGAPATASPPRSSPIPAPGTGTHPPPASPPRAEPSPATGRALPHPSVTPAPAATAGGTPPQAKPASRLPTDALRVSEFGVGSDVVDHRLVGRADRFSEGARVFFWTLVVGGQPGQVVRHVWFRGGRAVMRAELPIGGPHWRTRSSLVLGSTGPWTVEARTSDGRLLARNDFVCERRRPR